MLEPLDHIECRDALLSFAVPVVEATWPKANVVIGNPPFLGGSKKRRELGDTYFAALDSVFAGRVPGGADLVCYWFDKARAQMQAAQLQAAGLVATQAIRAGFNRVVLERLLQNPISEHNHPHGNSKLRHTATGGTTAHGGHPAGTGRSGRAGDRLESGQSRDPSRPGSGSGAPSHRSGGAQVDDRFAARRRDVAGDQSLFLSNTPLSIFNAWADEPWVNEGAAVRVSLVCFGVDSQTAALNGQTVARIHADLTGGNGLALTLAQSLVANDSVAFKGAEKSGSFEIDGALARQWLSCPNPHGRSNAEVLLPWRNGSDLSDRPKDHSLPVCCDASGGEAPVFFVATRISFPRLKTSCCSPRRRPHVRHPQFPNSRSLVASASIHARRWE